MGSGLDFNELTLVVWRKKDTIFRCDMATIGPALFGFLDADSDGAITLEELLAAMAEPNLIAFVDGIKCPVLRNLFHESSDKVGGCVCVCVLFYEPLALVA